MEATAVSVGKSVLNGALGYAKSAVAEEVALQLGIQKDQSFIADELEMMRSFMVEAHEERDNSKVVKTWVKQVRDTAYDVEDSLLDFAVRLKKPSWWRLPRTLLERRCVAKQMKELRAKVEVVSQRNVRYHLIKGSGSKVTTSAAEQSANAIATAIFGIDDARHASKQLNQRVELVHLISMDDEDPKVIAVWGTSGDVGVASTIMEAYDNPKVQDKFSVRAWVRVMHPFSPRGFVQSLVTEFQAAEGVEGLLEIEEAKQDLAKKFNEYVNNNRCLIVLNDLSTIEEWNQIKKCFQNIKKGSRILVSTLQVEVASLCAGQESQASELKRLSHDQTLYSFYKKSSQEESHSLNTVSNREAATAHTEDHAEVPVEIIKGDQSIAFEQSQLIGRKEILDPDDNLHLLRKKVFGKSKYLYENSQDLIEEEKQILKKCGGLPLAIAAIGGFLASQPKSVDEWRKLNDNIRVELETNPELEIIKAVLEKSYDGLPYHLKSCFLYLSIFPEDQTISRRSLVRRWMAEGYSSDASGKSASQIADDYFMELKNRSMILPSQQSVYSRKSIDSCKVHDLIRDIAISKSMEENLVFRLEEGCSMKIQGPVRHLVISSNWKGDKSEFESVVDLSRIRSLSVFGDWKPFFISDNMRFLRVLDLEGTNDDLKYHHLDQIWKLIHLKYLSLRGCIGIDLLPDSLGNLRQLQTLDVTSTYVRALPKTIIKLQKLQYIHAGTKSDYIREKNVSLMKRCLAGAFHCATCCLPILWGIDGPKRKALTRRDACTFACCMHFPAVVTGADEERRAMVPRGIRKLKDLHTLSEVNVGRGSKVLQDIRRLTALRKLGVSGINKNNSRAFCSAISNLNRLESLSVSSAGKPGLCGCLDEISSPPENLQSIKVYGNLEKLPEWIKELRHLVKLKLVGTRLLQEHDAAMEFLGKLPKLEILVLLDSWSSIDCEELDFKPPQGGIAFGSLRVFSVEVTRNIKSVKFEEGAMPKLERLQITVIGFVKEIEFSGLAFLRSINEVQVRVLFGLDWDRIGAAPDRETQHKIYEEEEQERTRKKGELKKKIQEQLAQNTNEPIVTVGY